MAMRTQGCVVEVTLVTNEGETHVFESSVEARCTDHATHTAVDNVRFDYPGATSAKAVFKHWKEL